MESSSNKLRSAADRFASAAIGILFMVCGGWILIAVEHNRLAASALGAILLLLGAEAVLATVRKRPPLLSKIGPLP